MIAALRRAVRHTVGSQVARQEHRRNAFQIDEPERGVAAFAQLCAASDAEPDKLAEERPIFILSAGWRAGSTLLQRLVSSDEDVLLWGEAYDRSALIQSLARTLAPFGAHWPPSQYYAPLSDAEGLSNRWVANLYPPPSAMLRGYRALVFEAYAKPARAVGAARWGFKEVRYGLAEAMFLKLLFPKATFLYIERDVADAYASYKGFSEATDWYGRWPDEPAFTPYAFARHGARLRAEFPSAVAATNGLLVQYEDLTGGTYDVASLAAHCGISIDPKVLNRRVGGSVEGRRRLTLWEHSRLRSGTRAGFHPPARVRQRRVLVSLR